VLVSQPLLASLRAEGALDGIEEVYPPLDEKPYFLVFSHAFGTARPLLVERLWQAVALARESPSVRQAAEAQQARGPDR
jgi:hypothetical protein